MIATCKEELSRLSWVCGPKGTGWSGEIVDVATSASSGTFPSYIGVFATRQTNGMYTQNYRLHFFYYRKLSTGSELARVDSSSTGTPTYFTTTTAAADADVSLQIIAISDSVTDPLGCIYSVKTSASYFNWVVTIGDTTMNSSGTKVYFNSAGNATTTSSFSTAAGYDLRYQAIDVHRDRSSVDKNSIVPVENGGSGVVDFDDTTCKTFIKNYLKNVTGGHFNDSTAYNIEIVSEDEVNGNFAHNLYTGKDGETDTDHPYVKLYAARLFRVSDSYVSTYRFFIFYYEKGSDQLRCLHTTTSYFTTFTSNQTWPTFYLYPVNTYPNSSYDGSKIDTTEGSYSALYYCGTTTRSYIRWNASLNETLVDSSGKAPYLEAPYYFNADTSITSDVYDEYIDLIKQYSIDQRTSSSSETDTVAIDDSETDENGEKYIDNPFPFLKFIQTRRKDSSGKYYYYGLDLYYFPLGDTYTLTRATAEQVTNASSTDGTSAWMKVKINDVDASSNPSIGLDLTNYHDSITTIKYTYTYNNASGVSTTSSVTSWSPLTLNGQTLYPSDYQSDTYDSSLPETNLEIHKATYNRYTRYSLYEHVDTSRPYHLGGEFDVNGQFYSKAYYFRPSRATLTSVNTLYGYSTSFTLGSLSYQQDTYNSSTAPYLTTSSSDRISGYSYAGASLFNWPSNYYQQRIIHSFVNSDGDTLRFSHTIDGTMTKGYFNNLIHSVSPSYYSMTYKVRLVPKSEEIKEKMDEIIASYDFSFDVGVKSIDEYARM